MSAILVVCVAGCSTYTAVAPREEAVAISVLPIVNESALPQIIAPLSRNLREKLAHSPNWELVDPEHAEVKLAIKVLPVMKRAMARDPEDTGRPLSFYEEVTISVEWIGNLTCPWGPSRSLEISSDHVLYSQPSLTDARTSAVPGIAERISDKVLQSLDWSSVETN